MSKRYLNSDAGGKMIPKKLHYIWLGNNSKPNLMDICINSWREKLPDYEIIEWNETNLNFFQEVENNSFLKECYKRKLWAFLSDYFRMKVLYEQGGIYLDTDMQIVKTLDAFLKDDFFIGMESRGIISAGIIGAVPNHPVIKEILDFYQERIWLEPIYTTPDIITKVLTERYTFDFTEKIIEIESGKIKLYPQEYFYPYHFTEEFHYSKITPDTYGIHWWGKSWGKKKDLKKLYFLEFKHYKGIKKLLINILIGTGLMRFVKEWKVLKLLKRKINF